MRTSPVLLPCLAALGVLVWWTADGGGFPVTTWAPGGLLLVGLLLVASLAAPLRWAAVPRSVQAAVVLVGLYAAWSYASVLWADDPGAAFEGAARTAVYAIAFALFALWPAPSRAAGGLLVAWVVATGIVAAVVLLGLALGARPEDAFGAARLERPTGYYNATAALLLAPAVPALVLAAGARAGIAARGALAGVGVLLIGTGLLALSRGSIGALPAVVVLALVLLPGRARLVLLLVPVAAALVVVVPRVLDVNDALLAGAAARSEIRAAAWCSLGAAVAVSLAVGVVLGLVARASEVPARARALDRAATALATALVLVGVVAAVIAVGDPAARASSAWTSFKGGYADNDQGTSRLVGGLGSNRYDFYRVALRTFSDHPVAGVGADGFYQQYLRSGRSTETPRYPHSIELRTLAQTGIVGALLLGGGLACALAAVASAVRRGRGEAAVAGAAAAGFAYWFVHGSVDWFWEWAALGTAAFVALGIACSLAPRRRVPERPPRSDGRRWIRGPAMAVAALVVAAPLWAQWVSASDQGAAAAAYRTDPATAYARLDRAATLDPLSAGPPALEGSIALRLGDLPRARTAFARALERVPGDQYATLELGAIASRSGDRATALALLGRATALAPRDPIARAALAEVRAGRRVDIDALNRSIYATTGGLGG